MSEYVTIEYKYPVEANTLAYNSTVLYASVFTMGVFQARTFVTVSPHTLDYYLCLWVLPYTWTGVL